MRGNQSRENAIRYSLASTAQFVMANFNITMKRISDSENNHMVASLALAQLVIGLAGLSANGQGTFEYDQQSNTDETPPSFGQGGDMLQIPVPWGQSFTPSLSGVDFIRLKFDDPSPGDGVGATVYVNLRSGSISGSVIGSSAAVAMPNLFRGTATFVFPSTVPLATGVTYYFEPVVQPGRSWNIDGGPYNYPGGYAFVGGSPSGGSDFWFREGVIVPEPSSMALILLSAATAGYAWHARRERGSSPTLGPPTVRQPPP